MARYFIFGGTTYYPGGGFFDLVGRADSLEEAMEVAFSRTKELSLDWWHVCDSDMNLLRMDSDHVSSTYGKGE